MTQLSLHMPSFIFSSLISGEPCGFGCESCEICSGDMEV